MRRRSVLAGGAALVALSGCLDVRSTGEEEAGDGGESFYETGTIDVVVDGEPVDLGADRFQAEYADEDVRFHFHEGDDYWHMEEERVTFAQAVDLVPRFAYESRDGAHVVTVDGTTYDGREEGVEIAFRVDGDPVAPTEHEVRNGEHLELEVTTGG